MAAASRPLGRLAFVSPCLARVAAFLGLGFVVALPGFFALVAAVGDLGAALPDWAAAAVVLLAAGTVLLMTWLLG